MELKWLAMVLVVLSLGAGLCDGCLEEERFALFQLKSFFKFINYRIQDQDFEFNPEKESSNCCEWERVECNPVTGRVTHLFLNDSSYNKMDWYLNASLFLPFEELQNLSLSENSIAGCVANQGFERLSSKLDKLENLDLSRNYFNDSILASLSELSSLKSLNLANNIFTISNPTNGIEILSKLNYLETLDLSSNYLGNNIISQLDGFASLKSLRLESCGLKGTVDIQEINNLNNLKELYLGGNEIESLGSLFHGKEGKFNKLEVLDLYDNKFNNSLFSSLVELSNLKSLDLSDNQLEGAIYTKDLHGFSNLEELTMYCNPDAGCSFSLQLLGLFPTLKTLSLGGFNINETTMASYSHNNFTSLKRLMLWYCKVNKNLTRQEGLNLRSLEELELIGSSLPSNFIQVFGPLISLKKLAAYDISGNNTPPMHDLYGLSNLEELTMYCNPGCSFSLQSLGLFPTLKTLSLGGFNINETTMASYSHNKFTSLKRLTLSYCKVNKNLTRQEGLNLRSLEELKLTGSSLPSNFIQVFGPLISLKKLTAHGIDGTPPMHGKYPIFSYSSF